MFLSLNSFAEEWASGHIYMTAGAAYQPQIGIENAGNPDAMKAFVNDSFGYGAAVNFPMSGLPKSPAAERIDVDAGGKISGLF